MRQSRYVWFLGLSFFCLMTIVAFKTPEAVISTLANPQYGDSPRATVQQFWKYMDLRQTNLAYDLLSLPEGSPDEAEFKAWESLMNKDPLLSLKSMEFMNSDSKHPQEVIVRILWTSSVEKESQTVLGMSLVRTENGWKIKGIKRIEDLM